MEFKGTKGEWTVRGNFKALEVFSSYGTLCAIARQSSIDSNVDSQAEANAKLIACAPEMLAILGDIQGALIMQADPNFKKLINEINELREKATTI